IIQSPTGRKDLFSGSNVLSVVIICGTLFLVFMLMMFVITVVMPRRSTTRVTGGGTSTPHDVDNLAYEETPMDAPQMSAGSKNEQAESKTDTTGETHGPKLCHKDPETAGHAKSRSKG
ncbi:hypothetical protein MRX96_043877, partial [Rhipicephalus microplus]